MLMRLSTSHTTKPCNLVIATMFRHNYKLISDNIEKFAKFEKRECGKRIIRVIKRVYFLGRKYTEVQSQIVFDPLPVKIEVKKEGKIIDTIVRKPIQRNSNFVIAPLFVKYRNKRYRLLQGGDKYSINI